MTVDEAKAHQKAIVDARTALNDAIFAGTQAGLITELEIHQITTQRIGDHTKCYEMIDVRCTIDPTQLD